MSTKQQRDIATPDSREATLIKAMNGAVSLPALPTVVARLVAVVDHPDASGDELVRLVSSDPVIALRILKQANSSYYDFSKSVCTVQTAISVLGVDAVKDVALGIPVFECATDDTGHLFDESLFWEHSVGCGVCAGMVAGDMGTVDPDEAYLAGLIHDVGRLVMSLYARETFLDAISAAESDGEVLAAKERELLDIDHCEVGGWLSKSWNLPPRLYEAILFHHQPELASASSRHLASLVNLADAVANTAGFRAFAWATPPEPDHYALKEISLDGSGSCEELIRGYMDRLKTDMKTDETFVDLVRT